MSNFIPKLEDASDEQLRQWIDVHSPQFGALSSDELTRRALSKLQASIEKFDHATIDYTKKLITLTVLLFFVALLQLVITAFALPFHLLNDSLIAGSLGLVVLWLMYKIARD